MRASCCVALVAVLMVGFGGEGNAAVDIPDVDYKKVARDGLDKVLSVKDKETVAKNVIFFLGDGMGIPTITASRIYKGQKEGKPGEETVLSFEALSNTALAKTYNHNHQVPDSAGTGTAFLCGVKTNYGMLGLKHTAQRKNCDDSLNEDNRVESILKGFHKEGRATGIVTTARLTHATPAAAYAYSSERYWENDSEMPEEDNGKCKDIAAQLIEDYGYIQVLMGGGRRNFWPSNTTDPVYDNSVGRRADNRNLVKEWRESRESEEVTFASFFDKSGFDDVNADEIDYMLGLFDTSHMQYEIDRVKEMTQPSLAEMTEKAIRILSRNDKGFFLLVEGGRIDHAHHDALPKRAFEETIAFDEAVQAALEATDSEDTLIVVTADHSHVMTQGGYPARGRNILGFVGPESESIEPTRDGYMTPILNYANGPVTGRLNVTEEELGGDDFIFAAKVDMEWETHGGEDVAVYAQGPFSHLFRGTMEQNVIPYIMSYAACVGEAKRGDHCSNDDTNGATSFGFASVYPAVVIACLAAIMRNL